MDLILNSTRHRQCFVVKVKQTSSSLLRGYLAAWIWRGRHMAKRCYVTSWGLKCVGIRYILIFWAVEVAAMSTSSTSCTFQKHRGSRQHSLIHENTEIKHLTNISFQYIVSSQFQRRWCMAARRDHSHRQFVCMLKPFLSMSASYKVPLFATVSHVICHCCVPPVTVLIQHLLS